MQRNFDELLAQVSSMLSQQKMKNQMDWIDTNCSTLDYFIPKAV